jgi:hypothetical protein
MLEKGILSLDEFKEGSGESAVGTVGHVEASPQSMLKYL